MAEAIELASPDVDLPEVRAVLRNTKNGTDRVACLPPAAVAKRDRLRETLRPFADACSAIENAPTSPSVHDDD